MTRKAEFEGCLMKGKQFADVAQSLGAFARAKAELRGDGARLLAARAPREHHALPSFYTWARHF